MYIIIKKSTMQDKERENGNAIKTKAGRKNSTLFVQCPCAKNNKQIKAKKRKKRERTRDFFYQLDPNVCSITYLKSFIKEYTIGCENDIKYVISHVFLFFKEKR
jgi:hypothetical protein